jgi:hypothetical protein
MLLYEGADGMKDGATMKRNRQIWLAIVLGGTWIASSSAQNSVSQNTSPTNTSVQTTPPAEPSLGNYARAVRKEKKQEATKKFDNDNLPRQDKLSVVGPGSDSSDSTGANASNQQAGTADTKSADAAKTGNPTVTPGESPEQRQKVYDQWKQQLSTQQSQIDQLSHELDLQQREYKMRAAEFYGDAGERLRNEAAWDKQDAAYKQKIADQQKALDEAKQKLNDLQEDARKSGVPSSMTETDQQ